MELGFVNTYAQISFYKRYSGNGYDYGNGIEQTSDSGYLITGSSSSFTEAASDVFLLKTDSLGSYEWSKHYGSNESDIGVRVRTINGEGHYVAGYSNSFGNGDYDFTLMRTNFSGDLQWQRNYGTVGWERLFDAVITIDSGMIMVGETTSGMSNSSDGYVVRTNNNGDTIWTKKIGGPGQDVVKSIRVYNDSTYIIGGAYYVQDSLKTKGFVMKIHENGQIYWMQIVGDNGYYEVSDLDIDPDRINFVGFRMNSPTAIETPFYGRMDFNGTLDYAYHESPLTSRIFDYITSYGTEGKKYIAYRYIDDPTSGFGFDVSVARLQNGLWWDNSFVNVLNPSDDAPGQIIPTNDGGVMVVGSSTVEGAGGANIFVVKVGPNDSYPIITTDQETEQLVSLHELNESGDFKIYPNPASVEVNIMSEKVLFDIVRVVDLFGKTVFMSSVNEQQKIQVKNLDSGTYFLEMCNAKGEILAREKLMIIH